MTKAYAQSDVERAVSGDETRTRLLAAAAELIVERGWAAATTRAVAERAEVNQALVHYHFRSVDALRRTAVTSALQPPIEAALTELMDDRPLPDSIALVMQQIERWCREVSVGVLMAEALVRATRDPSMARSLGQSIRSWAEVFAPRLELAQARGVVRRDIAAPRMALVLGAFLDGYYLQRLTAAPFDPAEFAETLIGFLRPPQEEMP
jgi:AcrR family transcriptional regulator